ncbi:unnamed protein product [Rhodiola kirilowii]
METTPLVSRLLRRCSAATSVKLTRQIHALLLTAPRTEPYTPFLDNNVLSMYAKCGSVRDAHLLFDRMPHRNLISFNAIISAYAQEIWSAGNCFELFSRLRTDGDCSEPNSWTFMSLMQATSLLRDRWVGSMLHCLVVKFGCYYNVCVQTAMLMMYSNCGDLGCSRKVFHDMDYRDSFAWDAMIIGNMKNDRIEDGLGVYGIMRNSTVVPTQFTYTKVFNGCARLGDFCTGRLVHAHVIISGVRLDLQLQNTMIDMYCSCGNTQMAFKVFNRIDVPDLVSWNTMISGFSEKEDGEKTMDFYVQFLRQSCSRPDEYTFAAVVSGVADMPCLQFGRPLHAQLFKWGYEQSMYAGSTLILMYLKHSETDFARQLFTLMPDKDVILWTEMITGHSQIGDGKNAIKFYHQMCQEGYKIDSFSLSGALSACADLATLKQGEMIHVHAIKTGNCSDMAVSGCLVDMYAKNGQLESAESLFSQLTNPEMKYWNSMLGGYSSHGKAKETFNLYAKLGQQGLRPDQVTYTSLLSVCSHCGLTEDAKLIWNDMREHDITPGLRHYSCMVTLLSRASLLEEANVLIQQSPYADNLELWRTLLSSCVANRNQEIGILAAGQILRLDPNDRATHTLLSNLHAATGRWDAVALTRRVARGLAVDKNPGLSWIEFGNNIHEFTSGDRTQSDVEQLENELRRLQGNMVRNCEEFVDCF